MSVLVFFVCSVVLFSSGVSTVQAQILDLRYSETSTRLYHSPRPWMTMRRTSHGALSVRSERIRLLDTIDRTEPVRSGERELTAIESLQYGSFAASRLQAYTDGCEVHIYPIRREPGTVIDSITVLRTDPLLGDVTSTYRYRDHRPIGGVMVPHMVEIQEEPGRLLDTVKVSEVVVQPEFEVESIQPGVFGVLVRAASTRTLVVEFSDHLLVSGAPFHADYGTQILTTIREHISPKPVRYFTYGHFHSHYTGGVRAFAAAGATVLSPSASADYMDALLGAPHSLKSDPLSNSGRVITSQRFTDSLRLSDQTMEVVLYTLGSSSAHTDDYTILYLPRHHLVFEDDSAWIPEKGVQDRKGARQVALREAILQRGLNVDGIIQGWPTHGHGVRTRFALRDL